MAHYRGDGERILDQAIRETDTRKKVDLLVDGMLMHFRELEHVLQNLGTENFGQLGLREIAQEVKSCLDFVK